MIQIQSLIGAGGFVLLDSIPCPIGDISVGTCINASVSSAVTYGFKPITGPANAYGDKDCQHSHADGFVSVIRTTALRTLNNVVEGNPSTVIQGRRSGKWVDLGEILLVPGSPSTTSRRGVWKYMTSEYSFQTFASVWNDGDMVCTRLGYVWSLPDGTAGYTVARTNTRFNSDFRTSVPTMYGRYSQTTSGRLPIKEPYDPGYPTEFPNQLNPCEGFNSEDDMSRLFDRMYATISSAATSLRGAVLPLSNDIWGSLSHTAAQGARSLTINTLDYGRDLMQFRNLLVDTLRLLKGKVTPKTIADAWLTYQYGFRNLFLDSGSIIQSVDRAFARHKSKFTSCRATAVRSALAHIGTKQQAATVTYHTKIYYDPDPDCFLSGVRSAMEWGYALTFQNMWDFVPFSFVVDWIAHVDTILARMDTITWYNTVNVKSVLLSSRVVVPAVPASDLFPSWSGHVFTGSIDFVDYCRWSQGHCPLPTLVAQSPGPFHNYVDATALILQKIRH